MSYTYTLPKSTSFTSTGLEGYSFGPLRQKDLDVYYVESEKGHDTFMVSKKITRTYYVLSGSGHFTIDNRRYDISPGMLVEVPPKVEYSYSGKMRMIAFSRPRWFAGNDSHTRWNPDVTCRRDSSCLPGREPWFKRLPGVSILGKSPVGAFLRLNRWLWWRLPPAIARFGLVRSYGDRVHDLARIAGRRAQALNTYFLRNRPELELICRVLESRSKGGTLKIAVLGCSIGAEVYSVTWTVRSTRPDLNVILTALDISPRAVELAKKSVYPLSSADPMYATIFERMTTAEKNDFFDINRKTVTVKSWIREGIRWCVGDVGEPDVIDALGPQDMVVASNFLCHMLPTEAERCLRNIARLVAPRGHLFVSGIDLDVRTRVARDSGWKPVEELLEEVHDGDRCLRAHWPWHYAGLEPLDKRRPDWKIRYAAAFQLVSTATAPPTLVEDNFTLATSSR